MSATHGESQKRSAPDLTPPGKTATAAPAAAAANGGQKKAAAEPKPPRESNFKKVYPDTARIVVLTDGGKNPKREGSKAHGRFALYAAHHTVAEYIKAGGTYSSLSWDTGHGFIRVEK